MKKKKGFTLIELIAVLVILAILALIVTPLVLNIIKKARVSADKHSIDAYGRSVELAIADYLFDTGSFPTSIEELTIEYSGDRVVCETTQLNKDSTVYLASCTVGGREITGYTYGKEEVITYEAYKVGQTIQYKGISFYVIEDSDASISTVKLLKAEPLTYEEVQTYNEGTGASNNNGIGGMQYGQTSNYATSYIKQTVESWANDKLGTNEYEEARLITKEELIENLGYALDTSATAEAYKKSEDTPSWVYNGSYYYSTMSPYEDSTSSVWYVDNIGRLGNRDVYDDSYVVRPVITLSKSAL